MAHQTKLESLTDQQKSTLLVRLARPLGDGCPAVYDDESDYEYLSDAGTCPCERLNLYDPANIDKVRYVLDWALETAVKFGLMEDMPRVTHRRLIKDSRGDSHDSTTFSGE